MASVIDKIEDGIDVACQAWLKVPQTARIAINLASITASAISLEHDMQDDIVAPQSNPTKIAASVVSYGVGIAAQMVYGLHRSPSLENVPIDCEKEVCSRGGSISAVPVLDTVGATDANTTTYMYDNYVPQPRTWQVQGYIRAREMTYFSSPLKLDVLWKLRWLDGLIKTRQPLVYKTTQATFHKVLVTQFSYEWDAKIHDGVHISLNLQEFVSYQVGTGVGLGSVIKCMMEST